MACIPVYKGKKFSSTKKLIEFLSTEEGIMAHLADGKDAEFTKAVEDAVGIADKTLGEKAPKAPKAGSVGVGGEDARKVMSKEIDSQVSAKENELIEKQKQDIEKAKNDLKAINSGDKSVIDEYVKKSGYKPVTKEVIANNPKSELLKRSEGKYYNSTGASIQVKTAEQIAIDGASKKANSKPTGSKTGTNQYVDAYNAITNFSEGKITAEEAKSIIEKAGLKIPKAVEQSLKATPKPKANKTSPLTPFQTKDKEGQAARAALKESVGPKEFKRLENIAKNGEKILRSLDGKIIKIDCP